MFKSLLSQIEWSTFVGLIYSGSGEVCISNRIFPGCSCSSISRLSAGASNCPVCDRKRTDSVTTRSGSGDGVYAVLALSFGYLLIFDENEVFAGTVRARLDNYNNPGSKKASFNNEELTDLLGGYVDLPTGLIGEISTDESGTLFFGDHKGIHGQPKEYPIVDFSRDPGITYRVYASCEQDNELLQRNRRDLIA